MAKIISTLKNHYFVVIFLVFYFSVTAYKFVAKPTPFYDWDEAIYAQVGREMVNAKSLVPLWQGRLWLDKPPLVPLTYGLVESFTPLPPEISTRLFTLVLGIIALALSYVFYYRLVKNQFVSGLVVIITAFTPIFLQRTQVMNVDVFLLIGWLGYGLFFSNLWLSCLFLGIGVLSKSLLGFYPAFMFLGFYTYQLFFRKINIGSYKKLLVKICLPILIMASWYVVMFIFFKSAFIKAHFIESHLKRVTASIESHFGKKTFYFDALFEQLGFFSWLMVLGLVYSLFNYWKSKKITDLFYGLFFVPWFFFLNLTKTKIAWYLYPVLAQFAFLTAYPLIIIKKIKPVFIGAALIIIGVIFYNNFSNNQFLNSQYSQYDENYQLAVYAKKYCSKLEVLIDSDSRKTHDVLKSMNLLISTSEWWGNHPSTVYYFGRKLDFIYDKQAFKKLISLLVANGCLSIDKNDLDMRPETNNWVILKNFKSLYLFKKI